MTPLIIELTVRLNKWLEFFKPGFEMTWQQEADWRKACYYNERQRQIHPPPHKKVYCIENLTRIYNNMEQDKSKRLESEPIGSNGRWIEMMVVEKDEEQLAVRNKSGDIICCISPMKYVESVDVFNAAQIAMIPAMTEFINRIATNDGSHDYSKTQMEQDAQRIVAATKNLTTAGECFIANNNEQKG